MTFNKDVQVSVTVSSSELEDSTGSRKMTKAVLQKNVGAPNAPTPVARVTAAFAPFT